MNEIQGFSNKYAAIGAAAGLEGKFLKRYMVYMKERWPNGEDVGYAYEWAKRFLHGYEWEYSDLEGQQVLKKIYAEII